MILKLALGSLLPFLLVAPGMCADWRPVGEDAQIDVQSVKPDPSGLTVLLRHSNLARGGMPPPAASALVHTRIDCQAHTFQSLDVFYYDAEGREVGHGGAYPTPQIFKINPGTIPERIEKQFCLSIETR